MSYRSIAFIMTLLAGSALPAAAMELKDITYSTQNAGKVVFSHKAHMNKKKPKTAGFSCKACHNSSLEKNVRYTMADMEKGKSCGACHNGRQAFALKTCGGCHKTQPIAFKVKETGPVSFSHTRHISKMSCKACHNGIYRTSANGRVSMAEMEKGKSCGACHNGKKTFALSACTKCHPVRDKVYKLEVGNVKFSHTAHIAMYKCGECHTAIFQPGSGNKAVTMGEMEKGASCGACHDSATAFTVKEKCDNCHK